MKLRIALFSAAALCVASVPAQAANNRRVSVTYDISFPGCGGNVKVTARGFGKASTTLTIYATNTPGTPGMMWLGTAQNKNNFAKASIPWDYSSTGAEGSSGAAITITVIGPKGGSAKTILNWPAFTNFGWYKCY
jgi:hypothetical protein